MIIKRKRMKDNIKVAFWTITIFSFLFQCYFRSLSQFIVPALIVFLLLEISNVKLKHPRGWLMVFSGYCVFLAFSAVVSFYKGTDISNIIRFASILILIPLAVQVNDPRFEREWRIFKVLSCVKAISMFFIWWAVFFSQDYQKYRAWAFQIGSGDIYILNKIPRVQLLGTSLFVLAAIIEIEKKKKVTSYGICMILAAFVAGNSAYILGMVVYESVKFIQISIKWLLRRNWKIIPLMGLALLVLVVFANYTVIVLEQKKEQSNVVRKEQVEVLMDANLLSGEGLGHRIIKETSTRNYNGDTYFELQTLYIVNQIGVVGLGLFYILTSIPYCGKTKKQCLIAYFVYLVYSFWNPYCFDSTHIITVLMITNILEQKKKWLR